MDAKVSNKTKTKTFQNLNKNCPLLTVLKLQDYLKDEYSILEYEQSTIFWNKTKNLEVFSNSKSNLLRVVVPMSETVNVIQKLKVYDKAKDCVGLDHRPHFVRSKEENLKIYLL